MRKSELQYIGRDKGDVGVDEVSLRGQMMKKVEEFTYLGSVITSDEKFTQDIERRRAGALRAFGTLTRRLWGR